MQIPPDAQMELEIELVQKPAPLKLILIAKLLSWKRRFDPNSA